MSMDKLRDEIVGAMDRYRGERAVIEAKIAALEEVLSTMDEMAEDEPLITPGPLVVRPFGTGRAPRRDVQGAIRQAVRDYMEAKGLGPRLDDVVIGAGILLNAEMTQSATKRALDGLIARGEMRLHDGRYAPSSAPGSEA